MKRLVEGYLGKDKKLYAAFMDLEKAYDRIDREALWSVLRIYGVGGQLLKGIQAFYKEANACVRVGGKFSESFAVEVGVRQGCVVTSLQVYLEKSRIQKEVVQRDVYKNKGREYKSGGKNRNTVEVNSSRAIRLAVFFYRLSEYNIR